MHIRELLRSYHRPATAFQSGPWETGCSTHILSFTMPLYCLGARFGSNIPAAALKHLADGTNSSARQLPWHPGQFWPPGRQKKEVLGDFGNFWGISHSRCDLRSQIVSLPQNPLRFRFLLKCGKRHPKGHFWVSRRIAVASRRIAGESRGSRRIAAASRRIAVVSRRIAVASRRIAGCPHCWSGPAVWELHTAAATFWAISHPELKFTGILLLW